MNKDLILNAVREGRVTCARKVNSERATDRYIHRWMLNGTLATGGTAKTLDRLLIQGVIQTAFGIVGATTGPVTMRDRGDT